MMGNDKPHPWLAFLFFTEWFQPLPVLAIPWLVMAIWTRIRHGKAMAEARILSWEQAAIVGYLSRSPNIAKGMRGL